MVDPTIEAPSRIFIACARCKARKRKCDGDTPRCSNCVAHNTECNYAAIRRTRGPGKKGRGAEIQEKSTSEPCDTINTPDNADLSAANAAGRRSPNEVSSTDVSPMLLNGKKIPFIFPHFFLSNTFAQDISTFKSQIREATSKGGFSPLMPLHMSRRLIEIAFEDIIPEPHFINFESFMQLFEAQYADNASSPGQDIARWALVNGVTALAGRFKMLPGSEDDLSPIHLSFYRNARLVLPQLIGQDPSLLSVRAILVMAMFARGIPDAKTFTMLVKNASDQLETLERAWSLTILPLTMSQREEFIRVYKFANELAQEANQV
ncbi:hypothetical protein F5Y10DRAFT_235319 [Nemania abortiva]|nr:hypothetical protein F5Y10DRAFT_235319 [Nemania abortiva]